MVRVIEWGGAARLAQAAALTVLSVAAGVGFADTARATQVQITQQQPGGSASDLFDGNGYAPAVITSGWSSQAVYAGGFALQGDLTGSGALDKFTAFCLDISHDLFLPSSYTVTSTPFTNSNAPQLSGAQTTNIGLLFDLYYTANLVQDAAKAAGFQLALWEIVNEKPTNALSLGTGNFKATSYTYHSADNWQYSPAAITDGNSYLGGLAAYLKNPTTLSTQYQLTYLQAADCKPGCYCDRSQNLVTVSAVPVPAAGFLLLTAFGGLGFTARRRRKAA